MPKVLRTDPIPVSLAQRLHASLPAGVDFAVVPAGAGCLLARNRLIACRLDWA